MIRSRLGVLGARQEVQLARALRRADAAMSRGWWLLVGVRALLPAVLSIATGFAVGVVQRHGDLVVPLVVVGVAFLVLQVAAPLHTALSNNLGNRTAALLYDELCNASLAPDGIGHLEDPALAADLQVARDFDRGLTGPPLSISMDFLATGLVDLLGGLAQSFVLFAFSWWAPLLLAGGWLSTHWLLRESGVWKDRNTEEVRWAQREADYTYRLAVDPPGAKELRVFGLSGWVLDWFVERRRRLHQLQYAATRMRERSVLLCLLVVAVANGVVLWFLGHAAVTHAIDLAALVVFAQAAVGASQIAFGGMNWALDGAAAPVAAVTRLGAAMGPKGSVRSGRRSAEGAPARSIHFRDVTFAYAAAPGRPVLHGLNLEIPAGTSLAIVGQNGAGKTTFAKLLCRLYDPQSGSVEVDGVDVREFDLASWRGRVTAVFQDFVRFELTLRDNVAPRGADDETVLAALEDARGLGLAELSTVLSKAYAGGTDLSGGQWQRVALARALAAVRLGCGVVLLDEPTAQLDVRGESEIFERLLAATRHCTTILASHRFSTVRHVDRIAVLEEGRIVELGSHADLMALGGRYYTMFTLQAKRFAADGREEGEEELVFDALS